tara:strand:- start:3892 stop:4155 length:264 start_codon:yes stop_codon:yes gene_type:complete
MNKIDKNIKNFLKKPFAKHNLETLKILNKLRSQNTKNKYCLICIQPFKLWQLAKMTGERGSPPKKIKKFFTNLEEAERYVFKKRTKK